MFNNKNAGNPDSWTYEPDLSKQAIDYSYAWSHGLAIHVAGYATQQGEHLLG
jgi:hypothetical protein